MFAEVNARLTSRKGDNDRSPPGPAPLPQKSHEMTETRDSSTCHGCSKDQENASSTPKNYQDKTGGSIESDKGGACDELAMLSQPEGGINTTSPSLHTNFQQHQHDLTSGSQPVRGIIPMPPIPDQIPRLPDTGPSGRKLTWVEALEHNASFLDDQGLYRAFQLRRKYRPEMNGPKLISAMAEYVGDAEDKMASLHEYLRSSKEQAGTRLQGGVPERTERSKGKTMPIAARPLDEVLLETRFYNCRNGFALMEGLPRHSAPSHRTVVGQYTSSSDPNYLIRVHFEWNKFATSSREGFMSGDIPNAKDIDVVTFMVSSLPLSAFFERRLGLKADQYPILKLGKPFRVVISNYGRLKGHLTNLMKKYDSGRQGHVDADLHEGPDNLQSSFERHVSTTISSSGSEHALQIYDQRPALEHFRLLVKFIDEYLGDKVALFEAFQTGREEMVEYEDLWMLFNNGQKVVCPLRENRVTVDCFNGKSEPKTDDDDGTNRYHLTRRRHVPQVYRLTAAVGGAPLISSLLPMTVDVTRDNLHHETSLQRYDGGPSAFPVLRKAKERFSSLQVSCMYVDFDGTRYGTEMEIFVFKPFDGQVFVKTLEAYPLNYFVKPGSIDFVDRGRKFIDLTASPRHMNHAGTTIGEVKEEVRSKAFFCVFH